MGGAKLTVHPNGAVVPNEDPIYAAGRPIIQVPIDVSQAGTDGLRIAQDLGNTYGYINAQPSSTNPGFSAAAGLGALRLLTNPQAFGYSGVKDHTISIPPYYRVY